MHLLFICTGNTCRSPLAEVITRRLAAERGLSDFTVGSAGTSAWPDAPASDGALLVALENGTDLGEHRARLLSPELVATADLVLAMGPHHLERAEALGAGSRAHLLTGFASGEPRAISDPFGGDLEVYRTTYRELEHEIGRALDRILAERR